MGEMYKRSENTLIWIQEEEELGTLFKTFIQCLTDWEPGSTSYSEFVTRTVQPLLKQHGSVVQIFQRLKKIINRRWFTRGWVVQEAVLSRLVHVLIGSEIVPMNIFRLIFTAFYDGWIGPLRVLWDPSTIFESAGYQMLSKIYDMREEKQAGKDSPPFFLILGQLTALCSVSEPCDAIYAFLGFQCDPNILIEPDYSHPAKQVMIETASSIIRGSRNLDLFGTPSCSSGHHPSWVPDWRDSDNYLVERINRSVSGAFPNAPRKTMAACCGRDHVWNSLCSANQLSVRGKCVDDIASKIKMKLENDFPGRSHRRHILSLDVILHYFPMESHYPEISTRRFFQALLVDCAWPYEFPEHIRKTLYLTAGVISKLIRAYETFDGLLEFPSSQDFSTIHNAYLNELRFRLQVANLRQLFISAKGKLVLARKAIPGDRIYILHGYNTPVILRPHDGGGTFRMVEDCYLEDAMYGLAVTWDEDDAEEIILV